MTDGKFIVLNWILKLPDASKFRPRDLFREGLSRSLVSYHLKKLVEERVLDFEDSKYWVVDKEKLVEMFVGVREEKQTITELPHSSMYNSTVIDKLNRQFKLIILMRSTNAPETGVSVDEMSRALDKAISNLTEVKKGVFKATVPRNKAIDELQSMSEDDLRELYIGDKPFDEWYVAIHLMKG